MTNLETNKKYCEVIESKIKLDAKPVAMKLIKTQEELPEGYDLIDEKCKSSRETSLVYTKLEEAIERIKSIL